MRMSVFLPCLLLLFRLGEIDVNIVGDSVAWILHLLQSPVLTSLRGCKFEVTVAYAWLTVVYVIDLRDDGAGEGETQCVDHLDVSVYYHVVTVLLAAL